MKHNILFFVNSALAIIGVITTIIFVYTDLGKYAYIPMIIGLFAYANTKLIEWVKTYLENKHGN